MPAQSTSIPAHSTRAFAWRWLRARIGWRTWWEEWAWSSPAPFFGHFLEHLGAMGAVEVVIELDDVLAVFDDWDRIEAVLVRQEIVKEVKCARDLHVTIIIPFPIDARWR